ncbi:MAG: YqaJ viral recombinase family protein [Actinomycetes bacterium]
MKAPLPRMVTPCADLVALPDTSEWHELRRTGVTASEIAGVLGLAPDSWLSPFSLYWRKKGAVPDVIETESMRWGKRLEAPVADEFADRHPEFQVIETGLVRNRERPWQLATPDRLLFESREHSLISPVAPLEVKTGADYAGEWGDEGTDEIPVYYRCQALWQADTLGLERTHVALLGDGRRYREYVVERDEGDLSLMRDEAEEFLRRLDEDRPPPVDGAPSTLAALRHLHPTVADYDVEVSRTRRDAYTAACRWYARAEAAKKREEARLRSLIGDGHRAVHDGEPVATRVVFDRKPYEVGPTTVHQLRAAKRKARTP